MLLHADGQSATAVVTYICNSSRRRKQELPKSRIFLLYNKDGYSRLRMLDGRSRKGHVSLVSIILLSSALIIDLSPSLSLFLSLSLSVPRLSTCSSLSLARYPVRYSEKYRRRVSSVLGNPNIAIILKRETCNNINRPYLQDA